MLSFLIITERLKGHSKFVKDIPTINPSEVPKIVENNKLAAIFYLNQSTSLKPLFRPLYKYRDQIKFFRTDINPGQNHYCITFPCVSFYKNGKHVRSMISAARTFNFEFWLKHSLLIEDYNIANFHEFSKTLNLPGNTYYSIGIRKRPILVPPDVVHYNVSRELASQLDSQLDKVGTYLYRHSDHEFVKINRANSNSLYSPLFDIGSSDLLSKPFIAILFLSHISDDSDVSQIKYMAKLCSLYPNQINYAVVTGDAEIPLLTEGNFYGFCGDVFGVFKSNDISENRWALTDEKKIYDIKFMREFLGGIVSGKQRQEPASQAPFFTKKQHVIDIIVNSNFNETIFGKSSPALVFIMSSCQQYDDTLTGTYRACARSFSKKGIRMYAFDQGRNDIPESLPYFDKTPAIALYPAGEGEREPYVLDQEFDIDSLYDFVVEYSGIKDFKLNEKEIKELVGFFREEAKAIEARRQKYAHEGL